MTNMTQFLTEIGEMNTQAQRVPGLEQSIRELQVEAERKRLAVEERETSILRLKSEMDALNQKLRSVEAERDDYGFRKLEAEDRVAACTRSLKEILAAGEAVLAQVDEGYVTREILVKEQEASEAQRTQAVEVQVGQRDRYEREIASLNGRIASLTAPKEIEHPVVNPPQEWKAPETTVERDAANHEAAAQSFDHGPEQVKPWEPKKDRDIASPGTYNPTMPSVQHNPASEDGSYNEGQAGSAPPAPRDW